GVQPPVQVVNTELEYIWGDSDGRGDLPGVGFAWEVIDGALVPGYDDAITCGLPIGFSFPFYGEHYDFFCMSTNGFLTFDGAGGGTGMCPVPMMH
ncbi:MAG: hypothetical protein QXR50_05180, partial [Archaeoglobaceae archaeon]